MIIKQRKVFESVEYEILNNGIRQTFKSLSNSFEQLVKFEDLGKEIIKESSRKRGWMIASIIFALLSVACMTATAFKIDDALEGIVFWVPLCLICFVIYCLTKKDRVYVIGRVNIFFFNKKSQMEEINKFIDAAIMKRNEYLRKKYFKIEHGLAFDNQIQTLRWLVDEEIIDETEYNRLKDELMRDVNSNTRAGFVAN